MKVLFISALLCFSIVASTTAQSDTIPEIEAIATDRPDQTESASIVPKGYVQMELGFNYLDHDGGHTLFYPNALIKYGVNENFELRLITSLATTTVDGQPDVSGFLPLTIGVKSKFTEENGIWPKISLIGHLTLPGIVAQDVSIDHLAPDFRFAFAHNISERFSLGYNLGAYWDGTNPEPYFFYSVAPGISFGNFGAYIEAYGFIPQNEDNEIRVLADGGVTYLVNNDLQLDISYSNNVTSNIKEKYIALGLSWRFKT